MKKILTGMMVALWVCMSSTAFARCVSDCTGANWEADGFCYSESDGAITIVAYTGDEQDVVIPETIDDLPVMYIGTNAFRDCPNLASVVISDYVISIGVNAFRDCPNLVNVVFPEGLARIGNNSFRDCANLYAIYFLGDAPSVGANAFSGSSDDCTVYYAPGAQGFSEIWRGYPTQESYPPEQAKEPEDPPITDQPPIFLCEPLWLGPWVGLSSSPSQPHKPTSENILFWAFDDDRLSCNSAMTLRWKYRPVELVDGEAVPLDEWTVKTPWTFLYWIWIEAPGISDTTGPGLFEFKMTLQDCAGNETDSEQFWGKRYYFQVD